MKNKRLSKFGRAYFLYLIILAIALIAIFFGVRSSMVKYESSTPEGFVLSQVKEASKGKGDLAKYLKKYCSGTLKCRLSRFLHTWNGTVQ